MTTTELPAGAVEAVTAEPPDAPDAGRKKLFTRLLIAALVVSAIVQKIGEGTAPTLIANAPLLLVAANPQARYVLLASQTVATIPLLLVVLARRMLLQPVVYALGRLHGRGMLGWFDSRFKRIGRMMRAIERWFGRWPAPIAVAFPGGLTVFLAGDIRMPLTVIMPLTALGLALRIGFTLWLGEVFSGPLESVMGFVGDHQGILTLLTFTLTAFHVVRHRQRTAHLRKGPVLNVPELPPPAPPLNARRLILRSYGPLAAIVAALLVLTLVVPDRRRAHPPAAKRAPVAESPVPAPPP